MLSCLGVGAAERDECTDAVGVLRPMDLAVDREGAFELRPGLIPLTRFSQEVAQKVVRPGSVSMFVPLTFQSKPSHPPQQTEPSTPIGPPSSALMRAVGASPLLSQT